MKKMRVLSLATLASNNIQGDVPYYLIAKTLEIDEDDVEMWIIDGMFGLTRPAGDHASVY